MFTGQSQTGLSTSWKSETISVVVGNPLPYLSVKKGSTMYTTTFLYYCFPLLSGFCQISVFYRCVLCVRTHCNGSFFIWWPRILLGPLQTSLSFWLGSFWLFFPLNSRAFYQLIVCYLGCCIHRALDNTENFTSNQKRFFTCGSRGNFGIVILVKKYLFYFRFWRSIFLRQTWSGRSLMLILEISQSNL